jgi:hypothetical protein
VRPRIEVSVMYMNNSKYVCNCASLMIQVSVIDVYNTQCVALVTIFSYKCV